MVNTIVALLSNVMVGLRDFILSNHLFMFQYIRLDNVNVKQLVDYARTYMVTLTLNYVTTWVYTFSAQFCVQYFQSGAPQRFS